MADYDFDPGGDVRTVNDPLAGPRAWCHVMYGLHALSALSGVMTAATIVGAFVFGWPSIIAVIINYVTRDNVRGGWLETHWRWQLRTFWFALLWLVVCALLWLSLFGIPLSIMLGLVTGVWVIYRVIRGWVLLIDGRPAPMPPPPAT